MILRVGLTGAMLVLTGKGYGQSTAMSAPASATAPASAASKVPTDASPELATPSIDELSPDLSDVESLELLDLEIPIVVTASRRDQKITDVPYAMSVITAEDIRLTGARTVPEALRMAAGVNVAQTSFLHGGVGTRGGNSFSNSSLLVLVDGRQIFDPVFGGTLWGSWPFMLEDIERIEVIRGPGGVTWGSNAMNGVINIITKDPADQTGLTIRALGGSRGWNREYLGAGFADDKLRLRVSGEYEGSEGFEGEPFLWTRYEEQPKLGRGSVHGIYEPTPDDELTFSLGHGIAHDMFPRPSGAGLGVNTTSSSQASYVLGSWKRQFAPDNTLTLTGYVNDFAAAGGVEMIRYRYQQYGFQLQHSFAPAEDHTLTWGFDGRADAIDASNARPRLLAEDYLCNGVLALYLQNDWQFAPRWTLSLGGRIDYDFHGGFEPSARVALAYQVADRALLYAAVSRAFSESALGKRFFDMPSMNGFVRTISSPYLDPATVMAYELGYRGTLFDKLDLAANVFWHEYRDLIIITDLPTYPGEFMRQALLNRVGYSSYGLEADLRYRMTEKLTLLGNYTLEQFQWRGPNFTAAADGIEPPKHKFMLGARYQPLDVLDLSSHLYYVDTTRSPWGAFPLFDKGIRPYFRWDLRAEYRFWADRASVAVGVQNLLDPAHPEGGSVFSNAGEVPRIVYAELRLRFD